MATIETPPGRASIDAVTLEVMRNGFIQVCEEVTITMLKTAHSVIFNEGKDLSTGVFDRDGRLIAQDKQGCPVHIAAMPQSVKAGIAQYGIENMNPGDVFLVNDSYSGGTHLPDVTIFAPVFWEDELVGFIGNRGHHTDVGGMAAGSMPGDATEMYQEGLILPAVRIFAAGERNRDVWNIMLANVRLPGNTEGDIAAQMAGVQTGMRRFHSMLERYGAEPVQAGIDEIIAYSERHMRREIAKMPDGTYRFADYMDTDGVTGTPVRIEVTARKSGSDIEFDFTGTDPQVGGAVNCVFSVTLASVWIGMLMVTDPAIHPERGGVRAGHRDRAPGHRREPAQAGLDRERADRDLQPDHRHRHRGPVPGRPRPCGRRRARQLQRLHARRQRRAATSGDGEQWVAILNPKGGWGGMEAKDGWTCIQDPLSNCRCQPAEALENAFPVRVRQFALRTGPGGRRAPSRRLRDRARHRGHLGLRGLHLPRPQRDRAVRALRRRRRRAERDVPAPRRQRVVGAAELAPVEHAAEDRRRRADRDRDRRRVRRPPRAPRRRTWRPTWPTTTSAARTRRRSTGSCSTTPSASTRARRPRAGKSCAPTAARRSCPGRRPASSRAAPSSRPPHERRPRLRRPRALGGVPHRGPRRPRAHAERQPRHLRGGDGRARPGVARADRRRGHHGRDRPRPPVGGGRPGQPGRRDAPGAQRPHGHRADRRRRRVGLRPVRRRDLRRLPLRARGVRHEGRPRHPDRGRPPPRGARGRARRRAHPALRRGGGVRRARLAVAGPGRVHAATSGS